MAVANVPALATVSGTTAGNTVTVSNVSGTALANVGGAALVQAGTSSFLVTQTGAGLVQRVYGNVHARAVHR